MTKGSEGKQGTWEVIDVYTRGQAIENGVLVDVSAMAREAGFLYPVALTRAVHERYVRVPGGVLGQDEKGRLWDVLTMLQYRIRDSKTSRASSSDEPAHPAASGSVLHFRLYVLNDNRGPQVVELKAICGPGDEREPVITILLPEED